MSTTQLALSPTEKALLVVAYDWLWEPYPILDLGQTNRDECEKDPTLDPTYEWYEQGESEPYQDAVPPPFVTIPLEGKFHNLESAFMYLETGEYMGRRGRCGYPKKPWDYRLPDGRRFGIEYRYDDWTDEDPGEATHIEFYIDGEHQAGRNLANPSRCPKCHMGALNVNHKDELYCERGCGTLTIEDFDRGITLTPKGIAVARQLKHVEGFNPFAALAGPVETKPTKRRMPREVAEKEIERFIKANDMREIEGAPLTSDEIAKAVGCSAGVVRESKAWAKLQGERADRKQARTPTGASDREPADATYEELLRESNLDNANHPSPTIPDARNPWINPHACG